MNIEIESVVEFLRERKRLNSLDVKNTVFTRGGKPVEVPVEDYEDWRFSGLNVVDFIRHWIMTDEEGERSLDASSIRILEMHSDEA